VNTKWKIMAGVAAMTLAAAVADATSITVDQTVGSGGSLQIGDYVYGNFYISSGTVSVAPANFVPAPELLGIAITGLPLATSFTDYTFTYTVTVLNGAAPITDIGQFLVGTSLGGGTAAIGETVFGYVNGVFVDVARSTVTYPVDNIDPPAELDGSDQLSVPGLNWIFVSKDIALSPNVGTTDGVQNYMGATTIYQYISISVPDGGTTVMLLGAALSGIALLRRKLSA
jgi:hypothetical protein